MRTTLCGICLTGLLSAVLITVLPAQAAEQDRDEAITVIIYPVDDLAVWSIPQKVPQFSPSLLIEHIKSAVEPGSWNTATIKGLILPINDVKRECLIVRQTRPNHKKVAELLTRLCRHHPDEEVQLINATDE